MRTPVPDYLAALLDRCREPNDGELADYIEQLAGVDPSPLAVALCTVDGEIYRSGDCEVTFSLQSLCKPFMYAVALELRGAEEVERHVDTEPSGDAFNRVSVEERTGRPRNPMINIGAITTFSLIGDAELVRERLSAFAGRELTVDEEVLRSELATADRNRALAFMSSSHGVLEGDPLEAVEGYVRTCSIGVTTVDLAVMGATLAHGGVNPVTGDRVIAADTARQVLSVMMTCGMYDAAGDWVASVGIPAKSGVSGGILGGLPTQVGIGAFSPRLDGHGNSVRGMRVFEGLSADMGLHLMSAAPSGASTVRRVYEQEVDGERVSVLDLQGAIHFSECERVMRHLQEAGDGGVVLDLADVAEVDPVGGRMLREGVRRVLDEGRSVVVVDPEGLLERAEEDVERFPDDEALPEDVPVLETWTD